MIGGEQNEQKRMRGVRERSGEGLDYDDFKIRKINQIYWKEYCAKLLLLILKHFFVCLLLFN